MNTSSLAKYHARSPRYILQPDDNTFVRIAGPKQTPWEEGTEIKNISMSGLAFTAPSDLCPNIGECIKIQYQIPGSKQMACYAMVTRLDDLSPSKTLVGVKYYRMELSQRIILAQGMALKLREQQVRKLSEQSSKIGIAVKYLPAIFLFMWAAFFYINSSVTWLKYFTYER